MSTSVLEAMPGKLDIKRHLPSILYLCNTITVDIKAGFVQIIRAVICDFQQCGILTSVDSDEHV